MQKNVKKEDNVLGRNIFSGKHKEKEIDQEKSNITIEKKLSDTKKKAVKRTQDNINTKLSKKDVVALHISDKNVVVIVLYFDGISYTIKDIEIVNIELPKITESTDLKDVDVKKELNILKVHAINATFEKLRLSKKDSFIVSSISGKDVVVKQLTVTSEEYENIEMNLPNLMMTPFGKQLTIYEHILLGTTETESDVQYEILGSAVANELFTNIMDVLEDCEIDCNILELDLMSIVNLYLESVLPEKNTINCILDIGEEASNIYIHSNGEESLFIRNLDFTYNAFRTRLSKNRDFSLAEADELLKNERFFTFTTKTFESKTTENLNKHFPIKEYINRSLLLELQKTIQFYSRSNNGLLPKSIYVTGKGAEINQFAQFIIKSTDIRCENMNISTFLTGDVFLKNIINDNASIVYKALGLALRND